MKTRFTLALGLTFTLLAGACRKEEPPPLYEPVAVTRRDITVAAEAAGAVEPILVVDVKSRASGTILSMRAETGDIVRQGDTLVLVDRRDPTNTLNQAQADLEVARAQLSNADAQKQRVDAMFQQQLVSQQESEQATLAYANARAQLVRAETQVQTARDALDDTNVRAPITGVIIAKNVEVGNVIASATRDVSGGVVLLRMADLNEVQVRTLVDETDIGKIRPGLAARVTVDAYPNQPFNGTVLKIEPQSTVNQNVTMFPVLIRIANQEGRLRPGMNAEVEIQVAAKPNVLAIPNAALRTPRDVNSAAMVLGLDPQDVQRQLAQADSAAGPGGQNAAGERSGSLGGATPRETGGTQRATSQRQAPAVAAAPEPAPPSAPPPATTPQQGGQRPDMSRFLPEGATMEQLAAIRTKRQNREALTPAESTLSARVRENMQRAGVGGPGGQGGNPQGGRQQFGTQSAAPAAAAPPPAAAAPSGLPPGVTEAQVRAAFQKRMAGQPLTAEEQNILRAAQQAMARAGNRRSFGSGNNFQFGGSYIVFVLRDGAPAPVRVRTGVTDMDYSEVVSGLTDQDTVLLLPSASLVQSQQDMRERFQRMTGGGVPGMRQATPPAAPPGGGGGGGGGGPRP